MDDNPYASPQIAEETPPTEGTRFLRNTLWSAVGCFVLLLLVLVLSVILMAGVAYLTG
jgi:hypothetical protein